MKLRLSIVMLAAGAAMVISSAGAIPFLHEDIASGGLDPDGDHYITGGGPGVADPMPAVYCNEGHADENRNGATTAADLLAVTGAFGTEPPANPLHDQNHNDQGDFLDLLNVIGELGGTVGADCSSAVADAPMPLDYGATDGPDLAMDIVYLAPQPPAAGPWGDIVVTVSSVGPVPDPYSGYWINVRYNELSVAGVAGSFTNLSPFTTCGPATLDNADDVPAVDDGRYRSGCGSFGATTGAAIPLASFTFDRIGAAPPDFCLGSFDAPDMGLALNGTYTFAPDKGAQTQMNTATCVDSDGDGTFDPTDNCPIANPAQADNDAAPTGFFGGTPSWIEDNVGLAEGDTLGGDDCDINDDNDLSCTDGEETTLVLATGGMRSPFNPWDFADVPVPALPLAGSARNGAITLGDAAAALAWVGRVNDGPPGPGPEFRDYDDDDNLNGVEDGAEYDRTPGGEISGPPSGAISLVDVSVILAQVGDSCAALPN
jgi:hypothetical protein